MSKNIEVFNHWYDGILNSFPFCLDDKYIKTIAIAWLFTEQSKWKFMPRVCTEDWQYVNAVFSVRLGFPFACFVQLRWSTTRLVQFGLGWKHFKQTQVRRLVITQECLIQTKRMALNMEGIKWQTLDL